MVALLLALTLAQSGPATAQLIRVNYSTTWGKYQVETVATVTTPGAPVSLESSAVKVAFLRGIKSSVKVRNGDESRAVKRVEWLFVIYDEQRRTYHDKLFMSDDVTIKPGKVAEASMGIKPSAGPLAKDVLPGRAVIVAQISKVTFNDGSTWTPPVECKANDSLDAVDCKPKP